MPIHQLTQKQTLRTSIEEAWKFFSNPKNLEKITPEALNLRPIGDLPDEIYPGLMIEYRVRPLFGIPMTWLTEITHVEPGRYFVDEQRTGPYRIWHHEHHLRALPDGTVEMLDRVTYQLPFGWLGNLAHPILVGPQVRKIFAHRDKVIGGMFGQGA